MKNMIKKILEIFLFVELQPEKQTKFAEKNWNFN